MFSKIRTTKFTRNCSDKICDLKLKNAIDNLKCAYVRAAVENGAERFTGTCKDIGINGLILPDLPFEEKEEFQREKFV